MSQRPRSSTDRCCAEIQPLSFTHPLKLALRSLCQIIEIHCQLQKMHFFPSIFRTTPIPDKELVIRLFMARRHVTAEALATATLPRQTKRRTVIFQWVASKMPFDQNVRSLTMCRLECRLEGIGTVCMDRDPAQQDSPTRHLHA